MLQGGFDGLDSAYLTTAGKYTPTNSLADARDCLSIAGRDDIRNHVLQLSTNPNARNYVPPRDVDNKIYCANSKYPNICEQVHVHEHLAGSTYVTLEDAVYLQEEIYEQKDNHSMYFKTWKKKTTMTKWKTWMIPMMVRIYRKKFFFVLHGQNPYFYTPI